MIRAHASLFGALLGAAALATPAVASAQQVQASAPPRALRGLSVSLVVSNGHRFGDGYGLFDRGDGDGGAGGEVALDVVRGRSTTLAVGLGIQGERYSGGAGRPVAAKLTTTDLYATGVVRWRSDATWQPYAGLAAGFETGTLALNPTAMQPIEAEALGLFGRASLGLRFAPRRLTLKTQGGDSVLALALGLEAAATAGTPLRFQYQAEPRSLGAGDSDRIPTGTVSLGSVSRLALQGRGLISVVF
jgi:hypothetical protein